MRRKACGNRAVGVLRAQVCSSDVLARRSKRQAQRLLFAATIAVPMAFASGDARANILGDFNSTGWQFNGSAFNLASGNLQLTDAINSQVGSAFFTTAQDITAFDATFT